MHYATTADEDEDFNDDLASATQSLSLRNQRKQIRQELTDPYNRLHSIALDSTFVQTASEAYPDFAVIPNLRCGQWYVDPAGLQTVHQDVYFKSTDGHIGKWDFNLRRPNLGLLDVIQKHEGVILVDSTRRGKRFPDALSKTIPIWCSVINRAIILRHGGRPSWQEDDLDVWTASSSVSDSERSQIRLRLQGWAMELAASTYELHDLQKPLRPLHISPSSRLPDPPLSKSAFPNFCPVICLSASRYISGGSAERHGSINYVPGSGDDHEGWTPLHFTPQLYWANKTAILAATRPELSRLLRNLSEESQVATPANEVEGEGITWIGKTSFGFSSSMAAPSVDELQIVLSIDDAQQEQGQVIVPIPQKSKSQYPLYTEHIDTLMESVSGALNTGKRTNLVILPETGKNGTDFGIGIALAVLTIHYDDNQVFQTAVNSSSISKTTVSRRLEWLITSSGGRFNPTRGILTRVNSYVFSR